MTVLLYHFAKLNRSSRVAVVASLAVIVVVGMYSRMVSPLTNYLDASQRYKYFIKDVISHSNIMSSTIKTKAKQLGAAGRVCRIRKFTFYID